VTRWRRGWRAALRIARREARKAPGRSLLVVAMIAVPVAVLAFGAVTYDTFTLSAGERADRMMGAAQAVVAWPYDRPVHQDPADLDSAFLAGAPPDPDEAAGPSSGRRLLALLPQGTSAITDQTGRIAVRTAAGTGDLAARELDYADPLARGILRQQSGRAPATAAEAALTPAAARRVGVGVGGSLRLAGHAPGGGGTFRVVGIVEDPTSLEAATIVVRPGALPADALSDAGWDLHWLVATPGPLTWAAVKRLNTRGVVAVSRHVLAHPPSDAERYPEAGAERRLALGLPGLVGGMGLLEIVLLAGPAFAVGARRRRRDLALVAATGGAPAHLRRTVLADGVVLGAVAAGTGVVLGVAGAAAGRPLLEAHLAHARAGGFRVFPAALLALAGLATVTGVSAALVPAWIAARQDVVAALAGRRGITRSRRRWVALGAALVAAGTVVAASGATRVNQQGMVLGAIGGTRVNPSVMTVILVGLVVVELGLVLCTPAVVGLVARLGRRLPLAPRIALRDTARNRTAAAPAISAVMAAVVGSIAVGVVLAATTERTRADYHSVDRPGDVVIEYSGKGDPNGPRAVPSQAVAILRGIVPVERVHQIGLPACGSGTLCYVVPQVPAARKCPYEPEVLRRDPTPAEQRAARRDARCDGVLGTYRYFQSQYTDRFTIVVDDPAAVGALTGLAGADADRAAAALRGGAVVVDHPRYMVNGRVELTVVREANFEKGEDKEGSTRTVTARGFALQRPSRAPLVMMTRRTARSLGVGSAMSMLLAPTGRVPTVAEEDRLRAGLARFNGRLGVYVERGPGSDPTTASLLLLAAVAGIVTLGAAAIATGLAAADGRADLATLAAVGASPRVRRGLSLSQSGVIAGLGSLLGAAAGLGGSIAVLVALNRALAEVWPAPTPYPITVPWLNVGVALLVVPLVAMLGAGLLTRSRLPIERRL
jgi:putative ABC transport system permease protein